MITSETHCRVHLFFEVAYLIDLGPCVSQLDLQIRCYFVQNRHNNVELDRWCDSRPNQWIEICLGLYIQQELRKRRNVKIA